MLTILLVNKSQTHADGFAMEKYRKGNMKKNTLKSKPSNPISFRMVYLTSTKTTTTQRNILQTSCTLCAINAPTCKRTPIRMQNV